MFEPFRDRKITASLKQCSAQTDQDKGEDFP